MVRKKKNEKASMTFSRSDIVYTFDSSISLLVSFPLNSPCCHRLSKLWNVEFLDERMLNELTDDSIYKLYSSVLA